MKTSHRRAASVAKRRPGRSAIGERLLAEGLRVAGYSKRSCGTRQGREETERQWTAFPCPDLREIELMAHGIGYADDIACQRGGAVFGRELRLAPARLAGLTGPNGAGKTTLLRLIAGLCRSAGREPRRRHADLGRRSTAISSPIDAIKASFTVRENLAFWADYLGWRRCRNGACEFRSRQSCRHPASFSRRDRRAGSLCRASCRSAPDLAAR